jgi:hypothetical protein
MSDQEQSQPTAPRDDSTHSPMPPIQDTMPRLDIPRQPIRTATIHSNVSYEFSPDKSFWNVGGYKAVLTRFEDGHELGNRFVDMLTERGKIDETYAKSLTQWKKKWTDHLNDESTEYASCKQAWFAVLDTAEEIATIHADFNKQTLGSSVAKVKQWLKEKYQKNLFSFKQKKEFDEEFEEAQKPWAKNIDKMNKAKKEYHAACKKAALCEQASKLADSNPDKNEDQKRKAKIESELAQNDKNRSKRKYEDELKNVELLKPRYVESMTKAFNKTQEFEELRMQTFKDAFLDFHLQLREQIKNPKYEEILQNFLNQVNGMDHKRDLSWWSEMRGAAMPGNWPVFEECNL